jgi:hypothetical protein
VYFRAKTDIPKKKPPLFETRALRIFGESETSGLREAIISQFHDF